jgi:hypothetical protein
MRVRVLEIRVQARREPLEEGDLMPVHKDNSSKQQE